MMKQFSELVRFIFVGVAAMLIHLFTVWLGVLAGAHPLWANVAGFLLAFHASFFGHCHVTFGGRITFGRYRKMFVVSSVGFLFNETAYWFLLSKTAWDYRLSLLFILGSTAAGTFVLAKFWVFGRSAQPAEISTSETTCSP